MINLLSRNILHLIVLLFVLISCQNKNEKINEIKLTVNYIGEIEGGEIRLQKVSSAYSIELYKSENFNNNKIVFDISLLESTLFRLDILGKESIDLILNNTDVNVNIDNSSSEFKYTIEGSYDTDVLKNVGKIISNYKYDIRQINEKFIKASQEKNYKVVNELRYDANILKIDFEKHLKNYLRTVNNSLAVIITSDYLDIDNNISFWDSTLIKYRDNFSYNSYFKSFEKKVNKIKSVSFGSVAPEIILSDTAGKDIALSSLRGKYVLLDFWAGWCGPCRMENPNILKNYLKYKNKGFEVYQVSLDRSRSDWVNAIKKDNLIWYNVSDLKYFQSEAASIYNIDRIPKGFLLDPNGVIIAKDTELRGNRLGEKLNEIFN
jgi:thiol-disulfide isomerase/thioredoxin|tara:strand:+ start:152 stop:1282 length:1131 start_codon:yes stop_codon:yes gene_type:complete